jgi:hypothetical protein
VKRVLSSFLSAEVQKGFDCDETDGAGKRISASSSSRPEVPFRSEENSRTSSAGSQSDSNLSCTSTAKSIAHHSHLQHHHHHSLPPQMSTMSGTSNDPLSVGSNACSDSTLTNHTMITSIKLESDASDGSSGSFHLDLTSAESLQAQANVSMYENELFEFLHQNSTSSSTIATNSLDQLTRITSPQQPPPPPPPPTVTASLSAQCSTTSGLTLAHSVPTTQSFHSSSIGTNPMSSAHHTSMAMHTLTAAQPPTTVSNQHMISHHLNSHHLQAHQAHHDHQSLPPPPPPPTSHHQGNLNPSVPSARVINCKSYPFLCLFFGDHCDVTGPEEEGKRALNTHSIRVAVPLQRLVCSKTLSRPRALFNSIRLTTSY